MDEERGGGEEANEQGRDLSPVPPKPIPVPSAPRQRESLDGETIFAVGEDVEDKWSDDEDKAGKGDEGREEDDEEEEGEPSQESDERQKLHSKGD